MDVVDQDNQPEAEQEPQQPSPAASSSSEPEFEPLEDAELGDDGQPESEPEWDNLEPPKPTVEPFTDDEIIDGTALITMLAGAKLTRTPLTSPADVALYQQAYRGAFGPIVPTKAMIAPLHLGQALARYGIGKGMMPGSLDVLPPYVRLALGAAVLGMSSYLAFNAVKREQAQREPSSKPEEKRETTGGSARGAASQDTDVDPDSGWQQPAGVAAS